MLAFILNLPLWGIFARFNCTLGTVRIPRDRLLPCLIRPFHAADAIGPKADSLCSL